MRLKKLILYGFKSFAQRTEIVFTGGITGIVGPNGSGKSNIGDAVRWVLGEQSAKTLRGASMQDVVFGGTQKRKPMSFCEASLVFDNEDRALPMDFAEIMVTRRVFRSGDSEYYLNGSACRLKDIVDLFRDTGIGKEGYSLIGQGRIDEILSRKSEDRRQVFEEAAGIVKFRARKEEADRKLARTLENADRVEDILKELERQLKPLEEQSRTARVYLELAAELKVLDLNLFLRKSDKAWEKMAELDAELMNLRTAVSHTEAVLGEKNAQREALQDRVDELDARLQAARERLSACTEQLHEVRSRIAALASRREARKAQREQLNGARLEAELRLTELAEAGTLGDAEERRLQAALTDAEAQSAAGRAASDAALQAQEAAEAALEDHKQRLMDAMNRRSAVQNDQTRLKTMQGQMTQRLAEISADRQALEDREQQLTAEAETARDRLQAEERRRSEAEEALLAVRADTEKQSALVADMHRQVDESASALQSEQARHRVLVEMTREMEGYSQSVRRAVQYAQQRGMAGVKGVLAQLIHVPEAYETAMDMALGAAQQNIVTDTEETAKTLIDYLRANRLGRATFLPMRAVRSKLLSDRERQVLRLPGCIGVASELIDCDPAYRPIVENLLGRTVIATDLDAGIPIMRAGNHAFRLVTLAGDVMHSGGSMTGGSTQSRGASLLSRERELKELTASIARGQEALNQLRTGLAEAIARRDTLRQNSADALDRLHQQEIAVAREQERCEGAEGELEDHRRRLRETADACLQLQEALEDISRQLREIDSQNDSQELSQTDLEEQTAALQQAVAEARSAAAAAAEAVMNRTLAEAEARHALDTLRREAQRRSEEVRRLNLEQDRRAHQLEELTEQDLADAAESDRESEEEARRLETQQRQEEEIRSLEAKRQRDQADLRSIQDDLETLHADAARDGDRIHRAELARQRSESDLRNLQDRIWNTYGLTYAGAEEFRQAEGFSVPAAERRAGELNSQIRALGTVNVNAVEEYASTKARYDELSAQQQDLRQAEKDLRELIGRLLKQMETTFVDSFTRLQGYFSETFVRLFGGGHAELSLLDPSDPLNCGIEVNAQPPGKKLQLLSLLSGGERALTAIAILFAMLKLKPTPFCILDEIEAALDDANIGYFADYLQEYSQGTQFIVITHRKGTMERCDALYGVAMEEQGVSRMVSVSLQDYQE